MNRTFGAKWGLVFLLVLGVATQSFGCSRAVPRLDLDTVQDRKASLGIAMIALRNDSIKIAASDTLLFQSLSRNVVILDRAIDSCTISTSGFLLFPDSTWSVYLDSTDDLRICQAGCATSYKLRNSAIDWLGRRPTEAEEKEFERFCMMTMVGFPLVAIIGLFSIVLFASTD